MKSLCVPCSRISSSQCTHDILNKSSLRGIKEIKLSLNREPIAKMCGLFLFNVSHKLYLFIVCSFSIFFLCFTCCFCLLFFSFLCHCPSLNHLLDALLVWFIISFELLSLDLASIFLSIPPSPSFLTNDSDVFLPEASGKNVCDGAFKEKKRAKHSSTPVFAWD